MRRLAAPILLASLAASGCARCGAPRDAPDGGPAPSPRIRALLPAPRPWTFERTWVDTGLVLPEGCRLRAPVARAPVPELTRFVAEPRTPGVLVVADGEGSPPRLSGVGALTLDPEGVTRDPLALPWFEPGVLPRLSRAGQGWIAGLDQPGRAGAARVILWRDGAAELVGEGDGFEATDLACGAAPGAIDAGRAIATDAGRATATDAGRASAIDAGRAATDGGGPAAPGPGGVRCALLTPRLLKVAAPGATVWLGAADEPAGRWRPVEILPTSPDSDAHPLGLAGVDGERVTVALVEKGEVVLHEVSAAGAREVARVPAPHGALDVVALPTPVVMAFTTALDDDGCARDGRPGVRLARPGAPPLDYPLPAPPSQGVFRRLAHGALALWLSPVGCRSTRKVVYALVLDDAGAPVGSPVPVGDASGFAAASRGDDVDLWIQDASSVTWLRVGCGRR